MNLTVETIAPHKRPELTTFAGKEAWIFDLDNTLYPRSSNLFQQVDGRIRAYASHFPRHRRSSSGRLQGQATAAC